MNIFRKDDGTLDRQYLRICAAGRLFDAGTISADRAVELMEARGVKNARATVEIWNRPSSLRDLGLGVAMPDDGSRDWPAP